MCICPLRTVLVPIKVTIDSIAKPHWKQESILGQKVEEQRMSSFGFSLGFFNGKEQLYYPQ